MKGIRLTERCLALGLAAFFTASHAIAQTPALPAVKTMPPSAPYRWRNVVIRAGGFVSGLVFSPTQKGLVYARTDVGGAYRSTNSGETWVSISDRFGRDESTFLGIESVALDPADANKLYIAAGMYSADWGGPAAIFRSNDKGRSYEKTVMPFKMGGNDNGRGVGERLAVDPNLGTVLYFGSRKAGMWKSVDSGVTWAHVDSFPVAAKVTGVGENTGITFIAFDPSTGAKGEATKTIYAGVAQMGATPTGSSLYRSKDAGATWEPMPGAPKDLFPSHIAINPGGATYFTYVDNIGPNGIKNGSVMKLTPAEGKWKKITPLEPSEEAGQFGYGGLAMDAAHPDTVMVTTIDRWGRDTIYRTTDGGKKWKDVRLTAQYSATTTPWVYWHKDTTGGTGWMSDIKIDPFDQNKVMYTTGEGIWGTANITAGDTGKTTFWGFPNEGLEETVPLGIVSPPDGAHLISVVGDIGGFRHDDITKSPALGFFTEPQLNTNSGLDFAELAPNLVVRVGYGDSKIVRAGYSTDNAATWKPLGSEPASSTKGGGKVALSADGKTVVWSPDKGIAAWSSDWGKSWSACKGITDKMRVWSDRVNPAKFYSYNADTGQLYVSADKAQSFAAQPTPVTDKKWGGVIAPTPGNEGDLWLSAGDKVYHSTDSGVTFVLLEGMDKVSQIGFGMPASGSKTPTIYMTGFVNKAEGIFRSDNGAQSWVRVDDPMHQFGWKNGITGDPRVYGRLYMATGGRGIVYGEPMATTVKGTQ